MTEQPDWAAVRADYEGGQGTLAEIRLRHGITQQHLNDRRRSERWTPRRVGSPQSNPTRLARRLMALLERVADTMESKLAQGKEIDTTEMRLLDTMVKTLERLTAMEKAEKAAAPKKPTNAEIAALRERLAQRIATLGN